MQIADPAIRIDCPVTWWRRPWKPNSCSSLHLPHTKGPADDQGDKVQGATMYPGPHRAGVDLL